jgi:hypothetical protein
MRKNDYFQDPCTPGCSSQCNDFSIRYVARYADGDHYDCGDCGRRITVDASVRDKCKYCARQDALAAAEAAAKARDLAVEEAARFAAAEAKAALGLWWTAHDAEQQARQVAHERFAAAIPVLLSKFGPTVHAFELRSRANDCSPVVGKSYVCGDREFLAITTFEREAVGPYPYRWHGIDLASPVGEALRADWVKYLEAARAAVAHKFEGRAEESARLAADRVRRELTGPTSRDRCGESA